MITGGRTQARDEMLTIVKAVADAAGAAVIWQDALEEAPVDSVRLYASVQHATGRSACIGTTLWESTGFVHIEVRAPVRRGGLTMADYLVTLLTSAFRGKTTPSGVWFRDVIGREMQPKDGNVRAEVLAQFYYQEAN